MEIAILGPWILLSIGSVAVLGACWLTVTKPQEKRPSAMWVFGVLLAGVGVYGPMFMSDYAKILKVIMRMEGEPSQENYEAFLEEMSGGNVPERLQGVGTAVMLQNPIPQLETLFEEASGDVKTPEAKARLQSAQDVIKAERVQATVAANEFVEGNLDREVLFELPRGARLHIATELENAPADVRTRLDIKPEDLRRLRNFTHIRPIQ